MKDREDRRLEAMFRSAPVPDDDFSVRVVSRVRRRIWVKRLSLPIAMAIGVAISAKPLLQLIGVIPGLVNSLFGSTLSIERLPFAGMPQFSTMLLGATLLLAVVLASKLLEE